MRMKNIPDVDGQLQHLESELLDIDTVIVFVYVSFSANMPVFTKCMIFCWRFSLSLSIAVSAHKRLFNKAGTRLSELVITWSYPSYRRRNETKSIPLWRAFRKTEGAWTSLLSWRKRVPAKYFYLFNCRVSDQQNGGFELWKVWRVSSCDEWMGCWSNGQRICPLYAYLPSLPRIIRSKGNLFQPKLLASSVVIQQSRCISNQGHCGLDWKMVRAYQIAIC